MDLYPDEVARNVPFMFKTLSYVFLFVMFFGIICIWRNPEFVAEER